MRTHYLSSMALIAAALHGPMAVAVSPQPASNDDAQTEPGAVSPDSICRAVAAAAAANDLPVEYFTRLIWQESRFNPNAVSRAGALGVAQFMPATAKWRGLTDPFEPLASIAKSAEHLRDLNREFGNLGFAAAAYNSGAGRVREWLIGRRTLPGETQAYVRIVTGRSVEEWAAGQKGLGEVPNSDGVPHARRIGPADARCRAVESGTTSEAMGRGTGRRSNFGPGTAEISGIEGEVLRRIASCRRRTAPRHPGQDR